MQKAFESRNGNGRWSLMMMLMVCTGLRGGAALFLEREWAGAVPCACEGKKLLTAAGFVVLTHKLG